MHLFLIGYRATGKTTVGQALANRLKMKCLDTDELVQARAAKSIREIFERSGEEEFRELESQVIESVCKTSDASVISLGGGAILRNSNRVMIKQTGKAIWLKASPVTIWHRISTDSKTAGQRPDLTGTGGLDEIRNLLAARNSLYQSVADFEIETDSKSISEIVEQVVTFWQSN